MVFDLQRTVYVFCQNDRRLAGMCESPPRTQACSGQSQTRVRPTPQACCTTTWVPQGPASPPRRTWRGCLDTYLTQLSGHCQGCPLSALGQPCLTGLKWTPGDGVPQTYLTSGCIGGSGLSLHDPRAIKATDAAADVGVGVTAKPCWELRVGAAAELPSWHQAVASAAAWHQVWGALMLGSSRPCCSSLVQFDSV